MYISLLSNVLNALFSAFAVFVLHAGVAGVAIGTVLSRLIGCSLLWSRLPISLKPWTWSFDKELLRLALPATGERLMMRVGDVVVVALITSLGTATVAGNAIGETLTQFNYMPALGLLPQQSSLQRNTDRIRLWFDIFSNKLWPFFAVYVFGGWCDLFCGVFPNRPLY